MNKVNIKPLSDRVLVEPLPAEKTTASGLIIPDSAKEKQQKALYKKNDEINFFKNCPRHRGNSLDTKHFVHKYCSPKCNTLERSARYVCRIDRRFGI